VRQTAVFGPNNTYVEFSNAFTNVTFNGQNYSIPAVNSQRENITGISSSQLNTTAYESTGTSAGVITYQKVYYISYASTSSSPSLTAIYGLATSVVVGASVNVTINALPVNGGSTAFCQSNSTNSGLNINLQTVVPAVYTPVSATTTTGSTGSTSTTGGLTSGGISTTTSNSTHTSSTSTTNGAAFVQFSFAVLVLAFVCLLF